MLATLAEYERELIAERVNTGVAAARNNGTRLGRPCPTWPSSPTSSPAATDARAEDRTAQDAAHLVGWSRTALYRHQQVATDGTAATAAYDQASVSASPPLTSIKAGAAYDDAAYQHRIRPGPSP